MAGGKIKEHTPKARVKNGGGRGRSENFLAAFEIFD
jgi:hypothetical protein